MVRKSDGVRVFVVVLPRRPSSQFPRCPQQEAMAPFPPTATCVLPMNAKQYYAIQDTPGFRSLLAQVMDQEVEVLDVWYKEDTKCEKVINRPDYEKWVPKIGRRFVKPDDIAFIDITEYAPRSQTAAPYHMKIQSILPLLGDRVHIERVVVISEVTPSTCRHTITGDVSVRVPGVGRMVEKYVMTNTVAAMNMLHTVVDRFQKVQEQLPKEIIPADLPGDLNTLLQSAYSSDEESELSAQATVDISRHDLDKVMGETEAGSAKHAEHDAHAVPAGSVHPEQAPPFKTLDRQGTKYFDADEALWNMDKDEGAEEEDLDVVIEVLIADEVEEDMADDDATDDVTDDVILAKGADKKLARKDRERHVRTMKFFSELRSLNLSSRRRHVHAEAETLSVGARQPSEEVTRWNCDKERWDKLWRVARVRAAPIPKALAVFVYPLRLDKVARRHKERRSSGEGTPPDDDASTSSEEEPSTGKEEASSGKEQTGGSSRGLKGRSVSGTGSHTWRHHFVPISWQLKRLTDTGPVWMSLSINFEKEID
ncbi:hypothetical protein WJX75_009140 [Coccomyxa subellipsoidea]|uniref:START domain-containing protein n=1 Tax=Coccomyxa subellipsoidea TaxID=248742 RepID=A0ABR2YFL4_9CHLO